MRGSAPGRPTALGTLRHQIVIVTMCATALAMVVLTIVLHQILASASSRDVDRVLEDRAEAVVGATTSVTAAGPLEVPGSVLDEGVVVYDASGAPVAGVVPPTLAEPFASLGRATGHEYRDVDEEVRLLATPFRTPGGAPGVVVVTERLAPYESAEHYALLASLATGLAATLAAGLVVAWGTRRALDPVASMTASAADWSEHDLSRRFDLGEPTNELTTLASVLDGLLDRVATAIGSEQRLTAELAHELRTPLTAVHGTAELLRRRPDLPGEAQADLDQMLADTRRMSEAIATMLELSRSPETIRGSGTCDPRAVIEEVLRATSAHAHVEMEVEGGRWALAVPHHLAVRALSPVLANAIRFATTRIRLRAAPAGGGQVEFLVEDDGPGVVGGERIFEPGVTDGAGSGSGLGLPLARRVARSAGGDVVLDRVQGPTRFVVRLPRA